jgi:AraC-like DNA-binding protein
VGLSPFHFSRVFRELAGVPPHRYLQRVRLARAAVLLREGMTVTDAALASGFPSLSHFIRQFRRAYGASPSRYGRSGSK